MKRVKEFIKKRWDKKSPLLLGLSGGPDSIALLHSLLDAGCQAIHVAHLDHGWRKESEKEREILQSKVEALQLPFYFKRLTKVPSSNLEDQGRKERLLFFRSFFEKIPFQALLLGHHADDLAETVLKRVFEGAHLSNLGGMQPESLQLGMDIWRPLLTVQREEIEDFLLKKNLSSFSDPTNTDPIFLRSRLRGEMFPLIEKIFGKKVRGNLCLLSERAEELKAYLDRKIAKNPIKRGGETEISLAGLERVERRHLLQKVAREEGLLFPRFIMEKVLDFSFENERRTVFISPFSIVSSKDKLMLSSSVKDLKPTA